MKSKVKLQLLITGITVIPLICITLFAYSRYIQFINNHMTTVADNEYEILCSTAQDIYNDIRRAINYLTFYSTEDSSLLSTLRNLNNSEEEINAGDLRSASENITATCQSIMYDQPSIRSIHIFTTDHQVFGHSRSSSGSISSGYDPTGDEWYQETLALNGSIYISAPEVYEMFGTDSESVLVSCLIRDVDRGFRSLGILVLEYSPDLFSLKEQNTLGEMAAVTLSVASTGSVLYQTTQESSENNAGAPLTANPTTSETVFPTPFELSMTVDYHSLSSEYSSTLYMMIGLALASILCVFLLVLLISRNFIAPIQQLSDQMLRRPNTTIDPSWNYAHRKDEIGVLYRQYNSIVEENQRFIKTEYQNKLILLDSQMKALEARINSHFLFNTLESINSMAELADQEQISVMSLCLGRMFRYAIKTESELVPLCDELRHVQDYVAIQQIRCDGSFRFIRDIPKGLYEQKVLKLILQPLVENSLIHGLDYGKSGDTILLTVRQEERLLLCTVSDNGKGIPEDSLLKIRQNLRRETEFTELGRRSKESIGLKNIHSRIELYYGKGYGLSIESVLGEGTQIHIRIPIRTESSRYSQSASLLV